MAVTRQPRQSLLIAQRTADFKRPAPSSRRLPAAKDKHGSVPVKMAGALCRKGGKGRRAARSGASGTRDRTAAGHGLPLPERAGRPISPEGGQHRRRPGPEDAGSAELPAAPRAGWRPGMPGSAMPPGRARDRRVPPGSPAAKNKDVPRPCRERPCKFWCERRDLNPHG